MKFKRPNPGRMLFWIYSVGIAFLIGHRIGEEWWKL